MANQSRPLANPGLVTSTTFPQGGHPQSAALPATVKLWLLETSV
jgi:hypothetical protein